MINLFVFDDSLFSLRFTTRTEQLTKCCGPLQKLSVSLWPYKTSLNLPLFLYYGSFHCDAPVVVLICTLRAFSYS